MGPEGRKISEKDYFFDFLAAFFGAFLATDLALAMVFPWLGVVGG